MPHYLWDNFFYEGEQPEIDFFKQQAEAVGFNIDEYLSALKEVRVFKRDEITAILDFYKEFVTFISDLAYKNLMNERYRYDHLTGVYTRKEGMVLLEKVHNNHKRNGKSFTLIMMDVDYFKSINDVWGHDVGDHILKVIAIKTQKILRNYDIFYRYGGEEFIICLPETRIIDAVQTSQRLSQIICHPVYLAEKKIFLEVTVSLGITAFSGAEELDELICQADKAMYKAKINGRNRSECFPIH